MSVTNNYGSLESIEQVRAERDAAIARAERLRRTAEEALAYVSDFGVDDQLGAYRLALETIAHEALVAEREGGQA